jgi:uncharacterized membrane protein YhaH (DUF805 family)
MPSKKEAKTASPQWFYYISISAAFLFTVYISVYSAIHFEDIKYMNIVVVFLSITLISFFLISAVYFRTEKMGYHALSPVVFFAGIAGLIIYAYKAADATSIVRYFIIYAITVAGISLFALLPKKALEFKKPEPKTRQSTRKA